MPTGGVDLDTAGVVPQRRRVLLGVGSSLVEPARPSPAATLPGSVTWPVNTRRIVRRFRWYRLTLHPNLKRLREPESGIRALELRTASPAFAVLLARTARATKLALAFLTVILLGRADDAPAAESDLTASRFAYPFVGGDRTLLAALERGLRHVGAGPAVSAFLLVAGLAILTGGLHLDGASPTRSTVFFSGGAEPPPVRDADPHIGSQGCFRDRDRPDGESRRPHRPGRLQAALALLSAVAVSRTLILAPAGTARYARPQGTGRLVIEAATRRDAWVASFCNPRLLGDDWRSPGLIAGLVALFVPLTLNRLASRRLGGITGDILGASELSELVFLEGFGLARNLAGF